MGSINDNMHKALADAGYTGSLSDMLAAFKTDYGLTGNDAWVTFLSARGYTGSINDQMSAYFADGINSFLGSGAKVIWLGDSIMAGDTGNGGGLTDGDFYTGGTWEAPAVYTDVGSGRTYWNEAVGGTALTEISFDLYGGNHGIAYSASTKIAEHPTATAVVFNGGINDIAAGITTLGKTEYTDAQMLTLVDDMLTAAQDVVTAAGDLPVMYISIAPREGAGSWVEKEQIYCDLFNSRMAVWCNANGVLFVDSQKTLLDPAKPDEDKKVTSYNGNSGADYTHMSQAGCEALAAEIEAVATSGAPNADAVVVQAVLDQYSNLSTKNRNALTSFVFRQSNRDNWTHIYDLWVFGLANETDALKGIKGNVATKATISGYAGTATAHSPGEGFQLYAVTGSSFGYINLGLSPVDVNPNYDTSGISFGSMIGATLPGTWDSAGANTLIGVNGTVSGPLNYAITYISWNRTNARFEYQVDAQFSQANAGATPTPAVGELFAARRQGAWDSSYNMDFWSAEQGLEQMARGRDGATVYPAADFCVNGSVTAAGVGSGGTTFTAAMAFLGGENINFKILTPQWTVRPRAGTDLLYTQLD